MTQEGDGLPELPKGWVWTTLDEIALIILGQSPPSSTYNEDGVGLPFYQGKAEFGDTYPTPRKWCSQPKKIAEKGDVLISVRAPVGPTNICPEESCIGRGLAAIRGLDGIQPRFILYLMRPFENVIAGRGTGTTFNAITGSLLRDFEIPLPPLPEQQRIVAKVEELFTQLDAGVAALEKAKAQLRRYRQAVLKAAVEGELTREWRKAHRGELEPVSVLLKHILEERRAKWEAEQLARMKARGKMPKDDKWKWKYKEPWKPDTDGLPQLPAGWAWTSFEELAEAARYALKAGPFGSSLKKEYYVPQGYKIYGQEQVIRGDPFYGDYYIDDERYGKLKSCTVKPGDILISLVGTIGRVLILPEGIEPGIINPRLVKLSLDKGLVNGKYIKTYLESSSVRHYFSLSSHGGTMDILNLTMLKALPVAIPPLREQQLIVDEVERCISIADELDRVADQSLKRAERLRQSILKRAFAGKLVPQDPSDEPASVLLERIKAEKARREGEGKGRKRSL